MPRERGAVGNCTHNAIVSSTLRPAFNYMNPLSHPELFSTYPQAGSVTKLTHSNVTKVVTSGTSFVNNISYLEEKTRIASTLHADAPCFSKTTVIAIRATVPSACSTGVFTQAGDGETPELITPAKPAQ
jgi:hypothetical protein